MDLFNDIPKLGFGMLRLPKVQGKEDCFDIDESSRMVDLFLDAGMRYFDTAYVYSDGGSERATRKALVDRYPRDRFYLATKVSAWIKGETYDSVRKQFDISLERLGTDYMDFYLLHSIKGSNIEYYDRFEVWDHVRKLKEKGRIKYWGFSFHDSPELLDEILTRHPDADIVQLQLNYADWENPMIKSRGIYEVARKHKKPIVVMEPVKGGVLADPPKPVKDLFASASPDMSPASWAIRYIASLPGIMTVLSGMSSVGQMKDNLSFMKSFRPMDENESRVIEQAKAEMAKIRSIPCTACRYCTGGCPMGIKIHDIFKAANFDLVYGLTDNARGRYASYTEDGGKASDCIHCRQCEEVCPQHIPITEWLEFCASNYE